MAKPTCPFCDQALRGQAELSTEDGAITVVNDCTICGRYAMTPEVRRLVADMEKDVRWQVLARLETGSIAAAADGTVVLSPEEFRRRA